MCCVCFEKCSEVNDSVDWLHSEDDVVRAWYLLYIVWPLYIFLVVITSAFSLLFFKFLLQALLSALCLNLNLDRMYSFDLQWKWNNDKIRMISKPVCVCLYWLFCVKPQSGLFSWTVELAELQSLFGPVENKNAF